MAEEYTVLIGAELKIDDLKIIDNKLKSIKNFKVKLDIDTSSFDNKIKGKVFNLILQFTIYKDMKGYIKNY